MCPDKNEWKDASRAKTQVLWKTISLSPSFEPLSSGNIGGVGPEQYIRNIKIKQGFSPS